MIGRCARLVSAALLAPLAIAWLDTTVSAGGTEDQAPKLEVLGDGVKLAVSGDDAEAGLVLRATPARRRRPTSASVRCWTTIDLSS